MTFYDWLLSMVYAKINIFVPMKNAKNRPTDDVYSFYQLCNLFRPVHLQNKKCS